MLFWTALHPFHLLLLIDEHFHNEKKWSDLRRFLLSLCRPLLLSLILSMKVCWLRWGSLAWAGSWAVLMSHLSGDLQAQIFRRHSSCSRRGEQNSPDPTILLHSWGLKTLKITEMSFLDSLSISDPKSFTNAEYWRLNHLASLITGSSWFPKPYSAKYFHFLFLAPLIPGPQVQQILSVYKGKGVCHPISQKDLALDQSSINSTNPKLLI